MGNEGSFNLNENQLSELKEGTQFNKKDMKRLYNGFKRLDQDGNGRISYDEFLEIQELASNPLGRRLLSLFDEDNDGTVDFKEFINLLNLFTVKDHTSNVAKDQETRRRKLEVAFKVYDIDRDGYISNGELFQVLKMMVGSNLNDVQLQQIVDKTILEADTSGTGKINFQDFCKVLGECESVDEKMKVSF